VPTREYHDCLVCGRGGSRPTKPDLTLITHLTSMASSAISLSKAEKSYIQSSILSEPPHRADGRPLKAYRQVELETGVAPLANGSAKVSIGREGKDIGGGTEVIAATKLEVEDLDEEGVKDGRVVCTVSWLVQCTHNALGSDDNPKLARLLLILISHRMFWKSYNRICQSYFTKYSLIGRCIPIISEYYGEKSLGCYTWIYSFFQTREISTM
jgi:hypothetical protein